MGRGDGLVRRRLIDQADPAFEERVSTKRRWLGEAAAHT